MSGATISYRELVFDLDLYPRMEVDAERVTLLRDVLDNDSQPDSDVVAGLVDKDRVSHLSAILESGGNLPPIVVDTTTRKVVDGFHRSRAYFAWKGAQARIPFIEHDYPDKGAMFLDAVRLNASHGKPLTTTDQTRCVALAERLNVSSEQLATVLNVRVGRVESLRKTRANRASPSAVTTHLRVGRVRASSGESDDSPVNGTLLPPGMSSLNQVLIGLQSGHIDVRDQRIRSMVRNVVAVALESLKAAGE